MVSNKSIECDQSTECEEDALDKWFLVLQPALENDYEQCEPQSAVVEMIFWVEEAVMFTLPKIQVPQPLRILVSQNFALKSWVSFLFSNCSELYYSRLLIASLLTLCHLIWNYTSESPWHVLLCTFCSQLIYSVSHREPVKKLLSYHFCPTQVQSKGMVLRWLPL